MTKLPSPVPLHSWCPNGLNLAIKFSSSPSYVQQSQRKDEEVAEDPGMLPYHQSNPRRVRSLLNIYETCKLAMLELEN